MNKKPLVFGVFAIVIGLVAALSVVSLFPSGGGKKGSAGQEVNQIFIAKRDVPIGTRLTEETIAAYLQRKSWPKEYLPTESISDKKDLLDRIVKATVSLDYPVLKTSLAQPGAAGVMPMVVEPGMRAFTVTVDEASGVGGFIVPGAYVDVIATFKNVRNPMFAQRTGTTITKKIIQNVRVLAAGQSMEHKEGQAKVVNSVTLQVQPEQVETLALAAREGQIALALRKMGDEDVVEDTAGQTLEEILGLPIEPEPRVVTQAPAAETPEAGPSIELIKGGQVTLVPMERH